MTVHPSTLQGLALCICKNSMADWTKPGEPLRLALMWSPNPERPPLCMWRITWTKSPALPFVPRQHKTPGSCPKKAPGVAPEIEEYPDCKRGKCKVLRNTRHFILDIVKFSWASATLEGLRHGLHCRWQYRRGAGKASLKTRECVKSVNTIQTWLFPFWTNQSAAHTPFMSSMTMHRPWPYAASFIELVWSSKFISRWFFSQGSQHFFP